MEATKKSSLNVKFIKNNIPKPDDNTLITIEIYLTAHTLNILLFEKKNVFDLPNALE